ncbi:hypothetical protein THASP1DRAFT_26572 [Thamnocephalis sphaerospora]|uniref:Secreted protein n=1 Tax=Thamnocephalis sphaerospora TaxID=78915 RepID=A0A4P9XHS5_9FUNG|nr:hypothetical protein THASP1DRAFT_26572 [Thamnocephalis sphaerospora]|eukprot:RKP04851.1 hypothetical protein THASP1DRAFT_26572 [Thamnocephalis sphaerospora]
MNKSICALAVVFLAATTAVAQTPAGGNMFTIAKNTLDVMHQVEDSKQVPASASTDCQNALRGDIISHDCVDDIETNPADNDFAKMCNAPADGKDDHRCSPDQVNSALDTLESRCGKELNEKNSDVVGYYTRWQTYTLNYDILCSKTASGGYCVQSPSDTQCVRDQVNRIQAWKPPRQEKYVNDSAAELHAAAIEAAKQNNIEIKPGNGGSNGAGSSSAANHFYASSTEVVAIAAYTALLYLTVASL